MDSKPIIFIDGSYYCFYRYHATLTWWKFAFPELELGDPFLNPDFVDKFRKLFVEGISSLPKKLRLPKDTTIIVGRDCKRADIWRHEFAQQYKGTRPSNNDLKEGQPIFYGCSFFMMVYKDNLFLKGGAKLVMMHDKLEGDDVIAISVKRILANDSIQHNSRKIIIITSDKDYLQLIQPAGNVSIYNAALKNISVTKDGSLINGRKELFIKTVMGDKSDNILPAISKCGYKTAEKCYNDPAYFESRLAKEGGSHQLYLNNKKLVDFDEIPENLVEEFWHTHGANVMGLIV
jgi:5'-3' exonuclease